jgi:hypothetical protein
MSRARRAPHPLEAALDPADGRSNRVKGARSRKRDASQQRPALDSLDASEKAVVLDALLRTHAELREEAEKIAHGILVDVDLDAVADGVEWDLRSLSIDELNGRAGRQRGGYVEPTDAAWELLGKAVEPHSREVERLLTLGLVQPAVDTALGVMAGLYRCRAAKMAMSCSHGRRTSPQKRLPQC